MQPRHHVSSVAIELIKCFEGFRPSAARLPDGRWTIGYGHTRSARAGARVDRSDAEALLLYDLREVAAALNELIFTPLTQNQVDALASFAMNIGVDAFRGSSVLLRINEGALLQAASALEVWRKADFEGERIVVDALVRRRAAEKALFLTPTDGYVPTPTPVVRPRIDHVAGAVSPSAAAVNLTTPLDGDIAEARREHAPDDADAVTSTEAASASVSARLQAILEDLDPAVTAPEPLLEQSTPPPVVLPLPDPSSHARRAAEEAEAIAAPLAEPMPILESDPNAPVGLDRVEPFGVASFDTGAMDRTPAGYLPLAFMLLVGVVLLAVATFWFVAAHPKMGGIAPSVIGWILGLTGIGFLAGSIYLLLERIGAGDDEG